MLSIFKPFIGIWKRWQQPPSLHEDGLETIIEYRQRWRSIHIIYFTLVLRTLGFTIVATGIWPYLEKLDPNAGIVFMGYVVAANPLGQILFNPLFGLWGNKIKSVRIPLYVTIVLFCLSSVLYSCLGAFPSGSVKYVMLLSRFLVGVGSANIPNCRAYIAESTRESERTGAISMSSMAQVIGIALGPALQSIVTPLGENGITIIPGLFVLNMYTATGWINVAMSIANIILLLPIFFKEKRIAALEVMAREGMATEEETYKNIPIDHFAVLTLLVGVFVTNFDYASIQSICTSMSMDQFAWSHFEALYYMGLIMTSGSIVSLSSYIMLPALCRRFRDSHVLIFVGFLTLIIGCSLNIPFRDGNTPKMKGPYNFAMVDTAALSQNYTIDTTNSFELVDFPLSSIARNVTLDSLDSVELVGCPASQEWCQTTPALPLTQFIIGFVFTSFGINVSLTVIQIIYSKILGCRPQGVWMGVFSGFMTVARILGPIFSGYIYPPYGMYWTFGSMSVFVLLGMLWTWLLRHRLMPPIRSTSNLETVTNDPAVWNTKL